MTQLVSFPSGARGWVPVANAILLFYASTGLRKHPLAVSFSFPQHFLWRKMRHFPLGLDAPDFVEEWTELNWNRHRKFKFHRWVLRYNHNKSCHFKSVVKGSRSLWFALMALSALIFPQAKKFWTKRSKSRSYVILSLPVYIAFRACNS